MHIPPDRFLPLAFLAIAVCAMQNQLRKKRLQCSGPQMIFAATNQRNWFCETGERWNACLQAAFTPNPPLLRLNEYIYIKSAQTQITLLPCNIESFFELALSGPVTDIKRTHVEKDHTNIIEMKGALCASIAYYISRRRQIFTVNLVNLSCGYRAKKGPLFRLHVLEQKHLRVRVNGLLPCIQFISAKQARLGGGGGGGGVLPLCFLVLDPLVNPSHQRSINTPSTEAAAQIQPVYQQHQWAVVGVSSIIYLVFYEVFFFFIRWCAAAMDCRSPSGQGWIPTTATVFSLFLWML